jgi:hypothetical protein
VALGCAPERPAIGGNGRTVLALRLRSYSSVPLQSRVTTCDVDVLPTPQDLSIFPTPEMSVSRKRTVSGTQAAATFRDAGYKDSLPVSELGGRIETISEALIMLFVPAVVLC